MFTTVRTLAAGLAVLVVAGAAVVAAPAATSPSATERSTLLSMREEEKLAHDVYVALAARWGDRVFSNIARAESRHQGAIERVLEAYGIADPTDGYGVGAFPSNEFQQLYKSLVTKGSSSRSAALGVGVEIEKLDIADLREAIRETDEAVLDRLYGNLLAASTNHLAAFERAIAAPAATSAATSSACDGSQQGRRGPRR